MHNFGETCIKTSFLCIKAKKIFGEGSSAYLFYEDALFCEWAVIEFGDSGMIYGIAPACLFLFFLLHSFVSSLAAIYSYDYSYTKE